MRLSAVRPPKPGPGRAVRRCSEMVIAFVALGANLGDRAGTLRTAIDKLACVGTVEAVSPFYETDPTGFVDQPAFLNAVARVQTALSPRALLEGLLKIESELGRERSFRNAPRTLDLDVLLFGNQIVEETDLEVPHPRLHERAFVLVPLADVGAEVVHPRLQRTVSELLGDLGEIAGVRRWVG